VRSAIDDNGARDQHVPLASKLAYFGLPPACLAVGLALALAAANEPLSSTAAVSNIVAAVVMFSIAGGVPLFFAPGRRPASFAERVKQAAGLLGQASSLVRELEAEMAARAATLERLREESASYEQLAAANQEQARAVTDYMDKLARRADRKATRTQWLFFVASMLVTVVLTVYVTKWVAP
jgi:hypothetical protein